MNAFAMITGGAAAEDFIRTRLQRFVDKYPLSLETIRRAILIEYGLPISDHNCVDDYFREQDTRISELLIDLFLVDMMPIKANRFERACELVLLGRRAA